MCIRYHWHRMHSACGVNWHRMHSACGVNDTACTKKCSSNAMQKKILNACGVNDTAFKVYRYSVSLTPPACVCMQYQWHRMHGACSNNDTACMMHAVSLKPHARRMRYHWHHMQKWHCMHNWRTIWTALAAFKGNIYQEHICFWMVLPHH
jgi:hypothetical protein